MQMGKKKEMQDYVVVNVDGFDYDIVQAVDEKDAIQEYLDEYQPKSGDYNLYVVQVTDNDKYTLDVTSTQAVKKAAWIS
jgi:hypothetical protein